MCGQVKKARPDSRSTVWLFASFGMGFWGGPDDASSIDKERCAQQYAQRRLSLGSAQALLLSKRQSKGEPFCDRCQAAERPKVGIPTAVFGVLLAALLAAERSHMQGSRPNAADTNRDYLWYLTCRMRKEKNINHHHSQWPNSILWRLHEPNRSKRCPST